MRFDIPERTLADGTVEQTVDQELVARLARELADSGVTAVAVCFLHSFTNPDNERAARAAIERAAPQLRVALSSDVVPEIREYERASTTVASVYVQSLVERYLDDLGRRLDDLGVAGELRIMLSDGGVAARHVAAANPIRMLESGPAAGALAAAAFGRASGRRDLLSFDMGGTTAKMCVVERGRPLIAHDFEVDRVYRLRKGSGLPVKTPVIDMIEIGVGGGSLARVTPLGLLAVGPESAGADPGPACYGRGGERPTVTDADLVLGYLNPDYFLGGRMGLDVDAARRALAAHIAEPLGATVEEAAWAIHRQVNDDMASAARVHASERGHDPSTLPLFAFGGAGPVHAAGVGRALGSSEVVVGPSAGVMSAVGMLTAPMAFELVRSRPDTVDDEVLGRAAPLLAEMQAQGEELLRSSGVAPDAVRHERSADMRFVGQGFEVRVALPSDGGSPVDAFHDAYRRKYGRSGPDVELEVLTWRVVSRGPRPTLDLRSGAGEHQGSSSAKGSRPVWVGGRGFEDVPVLDRYALAPGDRIEGPAIIEERESTLVVADRSSCSVGDDLSLTMALEEER
jgi:N-methylhydantoinase A